MRSLYLRWAFVALLFITFLAVLVLSQPGVGWAEGRVKSKETYASALTCGGCHLDIYNSWKNSLHAMSVTDPIYQAAYMQAYLASQGKVKTFCTRCHAPTTMVSKDFDMVRSITREGITCDFCHTVSKVDLHRAANPFSLKPGPVKRGSSRVVVATPAHKVQYADFLKKSEFCGACHQYTNRHGIAVLDTLNEWRNGPYSREGKPCQSCHFSNLHDIAAGRSQEQLQKTVKLQLVKVERVGDAVKVRVELTNVGAAHMVPTGMPNRRIILKLILTTAGGQVLTQELHYERVLADADGNTALGAERIFTDAARMVKDNRLAPRERRREEFIFNLRRNVKARVRAELHYDHRPVLLQPVTIDIPMASDEKEVPAGFFFFR